MKLFSPIRRLFHTMVMLHKIAFVRHFNHARKRTIVAAVVAVNAAFSHLKPETAPRKEEVAASLSRSNDFPDETFIVD